MSKVPSAEIFSLLSSMAGLGRVIGSKELEHRSTLKYGQALSLINAALNDDVKALQDETRASILVLGLYEVSPLKLGSYTKLVDPAVGCLY